MDLITRPCLPLTKSVTGLGTKPGTVLVQDERDRPQQQSNKRNQRRGPMWVEFVVHLCTILTCEESGTYQWKSKPKDGTCQCVGRHGTRRSALVRIAQESENGVLLVSRYCPHTLTQ